VNSASRLLGGRYQVGALIGRGGMAEVHAGHDTRLGRTVAIKLLRADLARDPAFLARFRREAQSAAGLNHPAIVAVYDSGEDEDTDVGGGKIALPYIVMEYVEGRTLREILNETTVMEAAEAARVTEGVLDALAYSHRMGIVHRDIKPANVMLTPSGDVKVMDFGIARAIADTAATMTQTHSVIGTAQYLSPEQAQGSPVDARSDLYSAGCLLYELLTGRTPFLGDSPVSIAYQHVGQPPQPPSVHQPGLGAKLDAVVLHALVKDREARYQDAAQFRSDLAAARNGEPISDAAMGTAEGAGIALAAGSNEATMAMDAMGGQTSLLPNQTRVVGTAPAPNTATLPTVGRSPADDEPPKGRKAMYTLITLAVIAALVLLGLGLRQLLTNDPAPTVTVPSVVTLQEAQAVDRLRSAGFEPFVTRTRSEKDAGEVIQQDPQANEKRPARTRVTITVSSGPGKVEIPDVTGRTVAAARSQITEAGLRVGKVVTVNDPTVGKGKVIETDPKARETVDAGSTVTLRVASGKVKVPTVINLNRGDAQTALTTAGLTYRTKFEFSNQVEGTVLSQTHRGDTVDVGTQIILTVAQRPAPTATPPPTQPQPTTPPTVPTTGPTTGPTAATTAP
jgi:beta-lactam-binding protein with PASTA domain/predicted Ser/Thr protein kinase